MEFLTERENTLGLTEIFTKDSISTVKKVDLEYM